jgi:hypothetical protein
MVYYPRGDLWEGDMDTNSGCIRKVTDRIAFQRTKDGVHFTIVSGNCSETYSIERDLAFLAINDATPLLRETRRDGNVCPLQRKNPSRGH